MEHKRYDPPRLADEPGNGNGIARTTPWAHSHAPPRSTARPVGIAQSSSVAMVWSCAVAVLLALANRAAVSGIYWNLNFFLIFLQSSTAVVVLLLLSLLGVSRNVVAFDRRKALMWLPLAVLLVLMNYLRLKALQCLFLPTHTIILNLELIVIACAEPLFTTASLSRSTIASFGIMFTGAAGALWSDYETAIASYGDKRLIQTLEPVDPALTLLFGCLFMAGYILLAGVHSVIQRKIKKRTNLHDWDSIWYNQLLMLPVAGTLSHFIEDFSHENLHDNFLPASKTLIITTIIASGVLTLLAPSASLHCTGVSGDNKSSFVDSFLSKMFIATSGLVWFKSKHQVVTADSLSAIGVAGAGSLVYVWARRRQRGEERVASGSSLPMTLAGGESSGGDRLGEV